MTCAAQRKFHVFIAKLFKCFTVGILLLAANLDLYAQAVCDPTVQLPNINGICSNVIKNSCVSACTARCADIGECIFGCEIGGINNVDTCSSSCTGLGAACLDSCLQTVDCINIGCGDVTPAFKINRGTVVYNRSLGLWQQTVVLTNTSCRNLGNLLYRVDALAPGWTLQNADGVTGLGVGYKTLPFLSSLASTTLTLQFTRAGTTPLTYVPRATGEGFTP